MEIDELGQEEFPRKLLDKRAYVRIDPETGEPQLIRVEPTVTEDGDYVLETVAVTIDDSAAVTMDRGVAQGFLEQYHCVPLEEFADWKHRLEN